IPVGTLAIGEAGAINAALLAASIIALTNEEVKSKLQTFRKEQTQTILDNPNPKD
ncbi:MAG: 5-(carboxyamino)imidazole ribonucleotide mutase, partial [Proteobacteria bacterium]|nr:5-(carboxyamino)imidazole ribonucleotide mutase [Pseudomonadota bacterium]